MKPVPLVLAFAAGIAAAPFLAPPKPADSSELARLYAEDQKDRQGVIDWNVVGPRDRAREKRVKTLLASGGVRTGKDHHRAAMVLQHAPLPDDYLLAHDLCVVALALGEKDAAWLAAATQDRYLMSLEKPQRWATQYRSKNAEPISLWKVAPGVTDSMRKALGVPTLAEAKKREAEFRKGG